MGEEKQNGFVKLIKWIVKILGEAFKDTGKAEEVVKLNSEIESGKRELKARELLGAMGDDAKDVVIEEGSKFLVNNYDVLLGLTPEQREYAMKLAYLKAIEDLDELSVEELMEYRKLTTEVLELGPAVAEQLHSFWEEFKNTAEIIVDKCVDIGVRAGVVALKTAIPALAVI